MAKCVSFVHNSESKCSQSLTLAYQISFLSLFLRVLPEMLHYLFDHGKIANWTTRKTWISVKLWKYHKSNVEFEQTKKLCFARKAKRMQIECINSNARVVWCAWTCIRKTTAPNKTYFVKIEQVFISWSRFFIFSIAESSARLLWTVKLLTSAALQALSSVFNSAHFHKLKISVWVHVHIRKGFIFSVNGNDVFAPKSWNIQFVVHFLQFHYSVRNKMNEMKKRWIFKERQSTINAN